MPLTPSFNGFALDSSNGVIVRRFEVQPTRHVMKATIEGADDTYLGKGYAGETTITVSGLLRGSDVADYESKRAAFLAALQTSDPAYLVRSIGRRWTAQVTGMPALVDDDTFVARTPFVIVFTARPAEESG